VNRLLLFATLAACSVFGQQPNNYGDAKSWLCRPGRHDACDVDLTTTVIAADGTLSRETWQGDANAPIDCFYVYPTVSTDPGLYSDMNPDPAELNVIRQQFARFGSKCRLYAPMYRQVTVAGLRRLLTGAAGGITIDHGPHYDDVRDAWNYYLEHDNQGRGYVLIGHSQGSYILAELIRQEIDGKPVQSRMVSAILPGATVPVGRELVNQKDVGGKFQHIPPCLSASQTGCLIAYSSFRSTSPPPATTRFGKVADPNLSAACTNPAALSGGNGELHAYFSTDGQARPWVRSGQAIDTKIDTKWVSVPGLLTARCTTNANATYLEITVHGDPSGPRIDDIAGDLTPDWGLHLIDVNLAIGNLVDIAGQQAKAWLAGSASRK
jgi:hypothetical protein